MKLTDPNRRGLLGQGSILVDDFRRYPNLTRLPREVRADHFLEYAAASCVPPNVLTLDESNKDSKIPKTVRAQLELHRTNQPCAGCHRVIDPPGFALENFNSVGQWRDKGADGAPLDVARARSGDGQQVNGPGSAPRSHSEPASTPL